MLETFDHFPLVRKRGGGEAAESLFATIILLPTEHFLRFVEATLW